MLPEWLSPAVAWVVTGAILLVVELSIGGFLAVFFAVGAWVTAVLLWIGAIDGLWQSLAVFLFFSVLSLMVLRRKLRPVIGGAMHSAQDTDRTLDDFVGRRAVVVETIDASRNLGKVEFRGTHWSALADSRIEEGTVVEILRRDNISVKVKPVEDETGS